MHVGRIDDFEDVLGPAQHGHEAGRLLKQLLEPLALGDVAALGEHLSRGLGAGAEHARDRAPVVANRRVAEGKMRFLGVAVAVHDERDVVHVRRLARIGARQDRLDLVPISCHNSSKGRPSAAGWRDPHMVA